MYLIQEKSWIIFHKETIVMGKKWQTQYEDKDTVILVRTDYDRKGGDSNPRTDFMCCDKATGTHNHLSVDTSGNLTQWHGYKK